MADERTLWKHPVTSRVRWSDNPKYMTAAGFAPYDGEYETDKRTGTLSADMGKRELQDEAKSLGLATYGTKDDLLQRIAEHAAAQSSSTPAGDEEGTDLQQEKEE